MFKFSKKEIYSFLGVLVCIVVITYLNILVSYRNERDTLRNLNISTIASGVESYKAEFGEYPVSSSEGNIVACKGEKTSIVKDRFGSAVYVKGAKKYKIENYIACEWGKDSLGDVTDESYPKYLSIIPQDPQGEKGISYRYESDGKSYRVYASYEGKIISDYSQKVVDLNIKCGVRVCNVGRSTGVQIIK